MRPNQPGHLMAAEITARCRFAQGLVTTARGCAYPTARETALKPMEMSCLSAQAFSGADLLYGRLAMFDPLVPVLAVARAEDADACHGLREVTETP